MSRLLDNFRENWLSVKMLINKEDLEISGVILVWLDFENYELKWMKGL